MGRQRRESAAGARNRRAAAPPPRGASANPKRAAPLLSDANGWWRARGRGRGALGVAPLGPKRVPAARRARVAAAAPDALPLRPLRCPTGGAMASRKSSRATGGSPSPGSKRETKHGGGKNGKKEGLSGSSFFTWFMVIALLGVWTSVAVVWFELVDYEEVLAKAKDFRYNLSEVLQGKLGIYDADGDGDFDVEDAKVLLGLTKDGSNENIDSLEEVLNILAEESSDWFYGFLSFLYDVLTPFEILEEEESEAADDVDGLKERSVPAQPASPEYEETVQPAEKSYVESEHKTADIELEEEIQSVLHEALHSHPGERHEDVDESVSDQWQAKEEIHGETFEAPATDDMLREFETEISEAYETPDSVQKDADPMVEDVGVVESESYEIPAIDDYVADLEERVSDPDTPGDSEIMSEDTVEHYAEDRVHEDYSEDQEPKHEKQTETQDTGIESKQTEDDVAIEPEESEKPVKAEDYSDDVQVDT
uniref:Aspartate beta-hydroxylase n=1 Tax=Zonotrichia albicollis TaxID=44394 RepID=A0A8D2MN66_ZONAL